MKILITTDTYFPMVNGVVTSINNLYKELKRSGHDVKILTLSHTDDENIIGDVYYLKSFGVRVYPNARVKVPFHNKLIKEILDWSPDIIHSQTEFSTMIVAKYISKKLNIPQIHTYHTMYEDYLGYILGGKVISRRTAARLTKLLMNSLDGVIVPTEKTKKALIGYGIYKDIYIIPTGIDLNKFQQSITSEEKQNIFLRLGIKAEDRIIAYVGRIAEEKNISEIILLFKEIVDKIENAKLLIVGGGPCLENLKVQAKEHNLENSVFFTGMVPPEEVYKYYRITELFVTASTSETQGLTYIEALASGCPVVCKWDSCLDGIIEQGKNGFAYKKQWEFNHYVCEILQDSNLRYVLSKRAVNSAKQFSSKVFADKILESYSTTFAANRNSITVG